jgi:putative ABC transport system permease protein
MASFHSIVSRLAAPFSRQSWSDGLATEFDTHLQLQIDENIRAGMNAREARCAALDKLGAPALGVEAYRQRMALPWLDTLWRDVRYGLRSMRRSPGFTAVAVLTLALGIGANTAIFSVVNGILLRALPYQQPEGLYIVHQATEEDGIFYPAACVNGGNFLLWRERNRSFSTLAALEPTTVSLTLQGEAIQVHGARVSYDMLPMLGIRPMLGRGFLPEEDQEGNSKVIILTSRLWRDAFGADPNIVGKVVGLSGRPNVVVGVLAADAYFPKPDQIYGMRIASWTSPVQYFTPLALSRHESKPGFGEANFAVIGRLKPGAHAQQALAEIEVADAEVTRLYASPQWGNLRLRGQLLPMKGAVVGPVQRNLWLLMVAAGVVLLIVCVNLASLLLGRAMGRAHEVAVRVALGASRLGVIRQFLIEGLLLSAAGGILGVLMAFAGVRLLMLDVPLDLPRLESIRVDGPVLSFSVLICACAGILAGAAPALRLCRIEPTEALQANSTRTSAARGSARLRDLLVGFEVALCTVLLSASLLLTTSLGRVLRDNNWLLADHVVTADLATPRNGYSTSQQRQQLSDRLLRNVESIPGFRSAGITNALPLRGTMWTGGVEIQEESAAGGNAPGANHRFVSPGYFSALGVPLRQGRFFDESDLGKERVVISEGLARQVLHGRNPIGLHVRWESPATGKELLCEITGVAGDVRTDAEENAPLTLYFPYWLWSDGDFALVVRTGADPRGIEAGIRRQIRATDSQIAIPRIETMQDIVETAVAPRRFIAWLGTLFAAFATFLAALGLYGVIALAVSQRTQEIGIRMALGARRVTVLRMILAKGVRLSLAGIVIGLACALAATRLIANLLYGVKPGDPATYAAVSAVLLGVTLLACYLPARRATRVDPMTALRCE